MFGEEQLMCAQEGWYKTTMPWKANHSPLPSNKEGSLTWLKNLTTKLQHEDLTVEYNGIIQEQLAEGVIKKATPVSKLEKEFYIPHKCVICKSAGAAMYLVLHQEDGITQTIVAAKARLAKRNLTIPRSLTDLPEPKVHGWFNSTVTLHWILGNGLNRQFIVNRMQKIKQHPQIQWRLGTLATTQ